MSQSPAIARTLAAHRAQFDAICAAPDDDGPRSVLADALSEAGDPLGEFITLQVNAGRQGAKGLARHRERELIVAHGRAWVPSGLTDVVFVRGFAAAGSLVGEAEPLDPSWRLIERLSIERGQRGPLLAEGLRALRSISGVGPVDLSALVSGERRPGLTTLSTARLPPLELLPHLRSHFPNVTSLTFEECGQCGEGELEVVLRGVPPRLQRLRLPAQVLTLKVVQGLLARYRPRLTLEVTYGRCALEVSVGASGSGVRRIDDSSEYEVECLISERLRAHGLREVDLVRRGASQKSPLYADHQVRFYAPTEPAPIVVRVSTMPPAPPPEPEDWH